MKLHNFDFWVWSEGSNRKDVLIIGRNLVCDSVFKQPYNKFFNQGTF